MDDVPHSMRDDSVRTLDDQPPVVVDGGGDPAAYGLIGQVHVDVGANSHAGVAVRRSQRRDVARTPRGLQAGQATEQPGEQVDAVDRAGAALTQ